MYVPAVGSRVKLRTLWDYHKELGVKPNWQWLRVDRVSAELAAVTVLDGDKPTADTGHVHLDKIDPPLGWRERKPGEYLFEIPPESVAEVRDWFKNRGGCLRWVNKDLGCYRGDLLAPVNKEDGTPYGCPHWAYVGESFPVTPEDIGVRTETAVPLPPEWFPKCERCNGTGKVTVKSLAKIRKQTQRQTLADLKADGRTVLVDDKNIQCWCCDGTGHKERHILVAVRKKPWIGYDLTDTGKAKARKTAAKLGPDVKWEFEHVGYGLAHLRFYREKIEPFTVT